MTTPTDNLEELLARVRAGRLDELTPEQVAALEAHLDATPAAAERLANVVPEPDPHLSAAVSPPTEDEWNAVWERVESATSAPQSPRRPLSRVFRLWSPLAAAAACLLLVVVWRLSAPPAWEIQLSEDVLVLCGETRLVKVYHIVIIRSCWKFHSIVSVHFTTSGSLLCSGNTYLYLSFMDFVATCR